MKNIILFSLWVILGLQVLQAQYVITQNLTFRYGCTLGNTPPGTYCPTYQFGGANIRDLIFWDDASIESQLRAAANDKLRMIRVFVGSKHHSVSDCVNRLKNAIRIANGIGAEQKFIICPIDYYKDSDKWPAASDNQYATHCSDPNKPETCKELLSPQWFASGYSLRGSGNTKETQDTYIELIDALTLDPDLANSPAIFAWEPGNELQVYNGNITTMLNFLYDIGHKFQSRTQQLVTTGFIGVNHAMAGAGNLDQNLNSVYKNYNGQTSPFDYITVHWYNNEWSNPADVNNTFSPQNNLRDATWSLTLGGGNLPVVAEEFGFSIGDANDHSKPWFGGGYDQAQNKQIPAVVRGSDRSQVIQSVFDNMFTHGGISGIMFWAYSHNNPQGAEGDAAFGTNFPDYQNILNVVKPQFNQGAGGVRYYANTSTGNTYVTSRPVSEVAFVSSYSGNAIVSYDHDYGIGTLNAPTLKLTNGFRARSYLRIQATSNPYQPSRMGQPTPPNTVAETLKPAELLTVENTSFSAYPNPFSQSVTLAFQLKKPGRVHIKIVDLLGKTVKILMDQADLKAKDHEVVWDGKTQSGTVANNGLYFAILSTPYDKQTARLVLAR